MNEPVNILQTYRIGSLDQRVQILSPTETQAGNGAIIQTWGEYATYWAGVTPTGGGENITSDQVLPVSRARFVFRYDSAMNEKMRLVWNSHTYNIVSIDIVPRNRFLIIMAESNNLSGSVAVDYGDYYATNSLKIRYVNGAAVAANSQAGITTILGITPAVAGAGYTALIRYNDGGGLVYNASLVSSDGTNWFWFSHSGTVYV